MRRFEKKRSVVTFEEKYKKLIVLVNKDYKSLKPVGLFKHFVYCTPDEMPPAEISKS